MRQATLLLFIKTVPFYFEGGGLVLHLSDTIEIRRVQIPSVTSLRARACFEKGPPFPYLSGPLASGVVGFLTSPPPFGTARALWARCERPSAEVSLLKAGEEERELTRCFSRRSLLLRSNCLGRSSGEKEKYGKDFYLFF